MNAKLLDAEYLLKFNALNKLFAEQDVPIDVYFQTYEGKGMLINACRDGDLTLVKILLTLEELKPYIDISYTDYIGTDAFLYAVISGHLDIVHYLLTSDEITEHANLYYRESNNYNALMCACLHNHPHLIHYFIIEQDFQVDEKTMNWLIENNKHSVLDIIQSRDSYTQINDSMAIKASLNISQGKRKI